MIAHGLRADVYIKVFFGLTEWDSFKMTSREMEMSTTTVRVSFAFKTAACFYKEDESMSVHIPTPVVTGRSPLL